MFKKTLSRTLINLKIKSKLIIYFTHRFDLFECTGPTLSLCKISKSDRTTYNRPLFIKKIHSFTPITDSQTDMVSSALDSVSDISRHFFLGLNTLRRQLRSVAKSVALDPDQ